MGMEYGEGKATDKGEVLAQKSTRKSNIDVPFCSLVKKFVFPRVCVKDMMLTSFTTQTHTGGWVGGLTLNTSLSKL